MKDDGRVVTAAVLGALAGLGAVKHWSGRGFPARWNRSKEELITAIMDEAHVPNRRRAAYDRKLQLFSDRALRDVYEEVVREVATVSLG